MPCRISSLLFLDHSKRTTEYGGVPQQWLSIIYSEGLDDRSKPVHHIIHYKFNGIWGYVSGVLHCSHKCMLGG